MVSKQVPAAVGVALLLVAAGCLGGFGGVGNPENDDPTAVDEPADTDELPDADELLEKATTAESTIDTVHGVQTTTWEDGDEAVTSTHEVWERAPNDYRSELVESDDAEEFDVMVSNGTTTWMYDGDATEAMQMELDLDRDELDALNEEMSEAFYADMNATVEGTDTVADRDVYVLELEADGEDAVYENATLWIDRETHYPLKQESTTAIAGEMTTTVGFEEISFDEQFDDDLFTFEPPADADVIHADDFAFEQYEDVEAAEAAVPFDLPDPDVPEAYALESVTVNENLAGWSASLQYADDTGTFLSVTVSESDDDPVFEPDSEPIEIGDVDGTVRELAGTESTMIEWEDDGLEYSLNGDLETDDLVAVAESIVE